MMERRRFGNEFYEVLQKALMQAAVWHIFCFSKSSKNCSLFKKEATMVNNRSSHWKQSGQLVFPLLNVIAVALTLHFACGTGNARIIIGPLTNQTYIAGQAPICRILIALILIGPSIMPQATRTTMRRGRLKMPTLIQAVETMLN